MTRLPDPRRPAGADVPRAGELVTRVQSGRLRRLLIAFGDERVLIQGNELIDLWRGLEGFAECEPSDFDGTIERQVRRYNETLRKIRSGFIFRYSRTGSSLFRVALES